MKKMNALIIVGLHVYFVFLCCCLCYFRVEVSGMCVSVWVCVSVWACVCVFWNEGQRVFVETYCRCTVKTTGGSHTPSLYCKTKSTPCFVTRLFYPLLLKISKLLITSGYWELTFKCQTLLPLSHITPMYIFL